MSDCPICYSPFEAEGKLQPLVLDCGHSLCSDCLTNLKRTGHQQHQQGKCPICKHPLKPIEQYKKNYSLIEQIEKNRQMTEEQLSCRCNDNPSFCCKRCKKFLCSKCIQNHTGHPISLFNPASAVIRKKAEAMMSRIDISTNTVESHIEKLSKAALDIDKKHKLNVGKLKESVQVITQAILQAEERTLKELTLGFERSLKEIDKTKARYSSCLDLIEQVKDMMVSVYQPIKEDEYNYKPDLMKELESACNQAEGLLKRAFEEVNTTNQAAKFEEFKLPIIHFKRDGAKITSHRISVAFDDCCQLKETLECIKLPKPRFEENQPSRSGRGAMTS